MGDGQTFVYLTFISTRLFAYILCTFVVTASPSPCPPSISLVGSCGVDLSLLQVVGVCVNSVVMV